MAAEEAGFVAHWGRKVLEIRPPVRIDKGAGIVALLQETDLAAAVYVGDDMTIIGEVKRHPNARVFSFGIGSSVNRFLLDKMAEEARGEVEYVSLSDDGSAAARRFHERMQSPLLTDVEIDWGGLQVSDVYPKRLPDLFSAKPVAGGRVHVSVAIDGPWEEEGAQPFARMTQAWEGLAQSSTGRLFDLHEPDTPPTISSSTPRR